MLNTIEYGTPQSRPSVLIAHGLFGSARNWGVIAKRLAQDRHVVAVDMRNHGDSPWFESHTYVEMADDLAQVIATMPGGVADVVGHSMGGKAAMMLALQHRARIHRMIVADIAPVTYGHTQSQLIDAMRRVDLAQITSRQDASEQLGVESAGVAAFLLQSLDLKNRRWALNLDVLERDMDQIIGFPTVSDTCDAPVLFLAGALSDYILPEHRPVIKGIFSDCRFAKIPGAGHWLHAEKPREFEQTLRVFLDRDV